MFHQRFMEFRFLESTLELLQQFYLQTESIAQDYEVFPWDQSKFCLKCLHCGKELLRRNQLGKFYLLHPWLYVTNWKYCHQSLLSMIHFQFSMTCQSFLPLHKIIQHQKHCLTSQFMTQLEMREMFYSTQKTTPGTGLSHTGLPRGYCSRYLLPKNSCKNTSNKRRNLVRKSHLLPSKGNQVCS